MGYLNNLKKRLIRNGWGEAIELLNLFKKHCPKEFEEWKKTGSYILLRDSCQQFKGWAMYRNQNRPLPFENDVDAIGACWMPNQDDNSDLEEAQIKIWNTRADKLTPELIRVMELMGDALLRIVDPAAGMRDLYHAKQALSEYRKLRGE